VLRAYVLALAISVLPAGASAGSRFFFSGDGVLEMDNAHFAERLRVRYRDESGRYDPDALARIERFFRSRNDGATGPVSLRLIELIDYVEDRWRPKRLTLISGYRSPELNDSLRARGGRVAQRSLHTEGLAADVQPAGVDLHRLWRELRERRVGGVGLYRRDGFLHIDTGQPRFWEPATSGTEKNLSADNARVFARTDFDRYADLEGAVIQLHSVTALPLRINRTASIAGRPLQLAPLDSTVRSDGECYVIETAADRYAFSVVGSASPPAHREPIRLKTCTPRTGATPAEIVTNAVEQ
jgi:uncharacterized protein YcbK (DUF882 family)